jgi:hypothetical protein
MLLLGAVPRPTGCKRLKGIFMRIDDSVKAVVVIKIAHRSEAYR